VKYDDFIDKIHKQTDCIRGSSKINVVNIKANRRGVASLTEVDEGIYEVLLSVGRIYIGWDGYKHIDILRCFKCSQLVHMAFKCEGAICCADCAFKIDVNCEYKPSSIQLKCIAYLKKLEHNLNNGEL
jgi:hypothetical protein